MNDIEQIEELIQRYKDSISTGNKENFYSVWSQIQHCSLISIDKYFEGIESIFKDFLQDTIHRIYNKIDLISEDIKINIVNNELAIIVFQYHTECIKSETLEEYGIKGIETQMIIKENNEWKILHIHYSKSSD